ncbi:MAG TPA: glycosyl hydrolase 53 family protein [Ohtaekwangia sp.]|nr:glycosyl hydrolase 53 family protein [Ohtaekwangia sp.]
MKRNPRVMSLFLFIILSILSCDDDEKKPGPVVDPPVDTDFYFGADLSYVNQVEDHGGVYKDEQVAKDPYTIFKDNGTNLVRLRLWHNPAWTKEVYGDAGTQMYNDLNDVAESIARAKETGMQVLLDFHYSDVWADPGTQKIPAAWKSIIDIEKLQDSVYNYTLATLQYLNERDLLPELVQLGNETNCGMLYTDAPEAFPSCNVCDGEWQNIGKVLNGGIRAVREVTASTTIKTKIVLHVADPKNVQWWFDNIKSQAGVTDFDVVGFSYYPLWHTTVPLDEVSNSVASFKQRYNKDVMILETAYPWTTESADSYNNHFGDSNPITGYPFSPQGQYDFLTRLTTEVMQGGGIGVVYWEPAWVTSNVKDMWGSGSSWENNTFFDFTGNTHQGIEFMKFNYE